MRTTLEKIADINRNPYTTKTLPVELLYLDTGSITDNLISELQPMRTADGNIPSRARRSVRPNSIVYSCVRPNLCHYGLLKSPQDNLVVSTGFAVIDVKDTAVVDSEWLYYYLTDPHYTAYLSALADTSTSSYPAINPSALATLDITVPDSLAEQRQQVQILSYIADKVDANRQTIVTCEQMLRLLYDYWFTQFDFPDADGKPYRTSGGAMIHNDELGIDIPEGWEVKPLTGTSLFSVIKTGVTKFDGTKRYLATADVVGTAIGAGNPIEYATRESRANMEPTVLSVWFAKMKDTIKHLFISSNATDFVNGTILSTGFFGLQCTESSFEYVASYVSHPLFEKWKNHMAHGATQKAVNGNDLAKIKIIEPSVEVLERFHEIAEPLYQQMNGLQAENEQLVKLRDFLLPLLMSGQVTVADDEIEQCEDE